MAAKNKGYRKLGRPSDQRRAMLRNMTTSLLENGRIKTTVDRAKEVRRTTEKMITLGKKGDLAARRRASRYITKPEVVQKLFSDIAPKYEDRQGGYTRIIKIGPRVGDSAKMAYIELV